MKVGSIDYRVKTATVSDLLRHLRACSETFHPPLVDRVDLEEYSTKLAQKSVSFEAWKDRILVGLIAAYLTNGLGQAAYITNVSVVKDFTGLGVASELMRMCIKEISHDRYREIRLEVHKENRRAISLYRRFKFGAYDEKDDLILMKLILDGPARAETRD